MIYFEDLSTEKLSAVIPQTTNAEPELDDCLLSLLENSSTKNQFRVLQIFFSSIAVAMKSTSEWKPLSTKCIQINKTMLPRTECSVRPKSNQYFVKLEMKSGELIRFNHYSQTED
ncbi:hypothetical protein RRG08_049649 [Elysia crispata]|uniref:Uncharacterized protein n=1 Tax=Elysia crispata TaxID=231223 RepID=A0AAE0Y5Z4_9GAST|nr:hypothetical protein RRG08_049649 [Elysia crispata]